MKPRPAGRPERTRDAVKLPPGGTPPLSHPAMLASLAMVAAVLVLCVTYVIFDPDIWEHLLVGKAIWQGHSIPDRQIWTWPTYGAPDLTPSWLFRALIWPVWSVGGVWGLFAWRWLTTLLAFGLLWATARRMGARGFAALGVLVLCAMSYRTRSQARPETLVAVLIALEIWILEARRRGFGDRSLWIVPIAWIWVNAHISYYLAFAILGVYLLDDLWKARAGGSVERRGTLRLALVGLAALAISFLNPFGWRSLWQPFDYFLHLRHEPIFLSIDELKPFDWKNSFSDSISLVLVAWPLLNLWRIVRRRTDLVDLLFCAFFTLTAVMSQRFLGFYSLAAAPFVMRDLDELTASVPWPFPRLPAWGRAGTIALLCIAVALGEWWRPSPAVGVGMDERYYPIQACNFIAENGVRGRMFNQFYEGGYLLYRFWPERERLPFMDIHQAGGPRIRLLYMLALGSARDWRAADDTFHFDYVVSDRVRNPEQPVLDVLDADSTLALVFLDDAAAVYVRRGGAMQPLVDRFGYRLLPAGRSAIGPLGEACARDSVLRWKVAAELTRAVESSPWNAVALSLLANVALVEGRLEDGRVLIERAMKVDPSVGRAHERLGAIAMEMGRPRDALREFEIERAVDPRRPGISLRLGQSWRRLGETGKAREWYQRELAISPGDREALDSLRSLGSAR